jgi:hypothetical protein
MARHVTVAVVAIASWPVTIVPVVYVFAGDRFFTYETFKFWFFFHDPSISS